MKPDENSTSSDPKRFEWNDKYLLGYDPMDKTHEEFVSLVGTLLTIDDNRFAAALNRFSTHLEAHFSEEEKWMISGDFHARDCHIDEHQKVRASLAEVQEQVENGEFEIGRSFAHALKDWFPGHADYMDSALANWLVKSKFGGAPVVLRRLVGRQA